MPIILRRPERKIGLVVLLALTVVAGGIYRSFADTGAANSGTTTADGLSATYYDNTDFTGPSVSRVDPSINFSWGSANGSPDPKIAPTSFSARWTGTLTAPETGTYQFSTRSDDGVRVWIADQLIINSWTNHGPLTDSGTIALKQNQRYPIKVEYYQDGGGAQLTLLWRVPGADTVVVPASAFMTKNANPTPPPSTTPGATPSAAPTPPVSAGGCRPSASNCLVQWKPRCPAYPAFPDGSCTGVPASTVLANLAGCSGGEFHVRSDTVIDAKTVNCVLIVQNGAKLTIQRSKVNGPIANEDGTVVVADSEVDGGTIKGGTLGSRTTVLGSNIHGGAAAFQCDESCYAEDTWFHGNYLPTGPGLDPGKDSWHLDSFITNGVTNHCGAYTSTCYNVQLIHNSLNCDHAVNSVDGGCSGNIGLFGDFAPITGILVDRNFLGANKDSAYCVYGGDSTTKAFNHADHIVYTNNVFARGSTNRCAAFGPVTSFNTNGKGNIWANNKFQDGTPVTPAN